MKHHRLLFAASMLGSLALCGLADPLEAQPLLFTEDLCGPQGAGQIGTNWISLASDGVITTPEQLCLAITPTPLTVAVLFPDGTGKYEFDCATMTCTSTNTIPEPGCTTSACFCIKPGEGASVVTSAPSTLPIYGCDSFVTINIPIMIGPGLRGTLVSVPFRSPLVTFNDLGLHFGLPAGLLKGSVTGLNCTTGQQTTIQVGTAAGSAALLVPGRAYLLGSPTAGVYSATNPVACIPPNPAAAACPIDSLSITPSGSDAIVTWSPPGAGCGLPLDYQVARFDPDCLVHSCKPCPSCTIIATTTATTFTDTPPSGNWDYLVSVVGGTWNSTSTSQCVDRDVMFSLGCP